MLRSTTQHHLWLALLGTILLAVPVTAQPLHGLDDFAAADSPATDGLLPAGLSGFGARPGTSGPPVTFSASILVDKEDHTQGVLSIQAKLNGNWHIYSVTQKDGGPTRTEITVNPHPQIEVISDFQPDAPPTVADSEFFDVPVEEHHGEVVWRAKLRIADGAAPEQLVMTGHVAGLVCDQGCQPITPKMGAFEAGFQEYFDLGGWFAQTQQADATSEPTPGSVPVADLIYYITLGFIGGLVLNVMPCVLPVIGLKILSFTQQAGEDRKRIIALNFVFVAGILAVFGTLAFMAAFFQLTWGEQFQNAWFTVMLVAVTFAFALSLLGVWEISIPSVLGSGKAAQAASKEGYSGAFAKGILSTLLATPCGGPFIAPLLAWAAAQHKAVVFATFLSMGLGMGAPYLLIGFFPRMIAILPRPGAWMETFKHIMGFVLLATVVWLTSVLESELFIPTFALLIAIWAACWWVGRISITASRGRKLRNLLGASAFAALVAYGSFTFLVPFDEFELYTPERFAELQASGSNVMLDFTADWCTSCKFNERLAFRNRRTRRYLEENNVVVLVGDMTQANPPASELMQKLGNKGEALPYYAVFPADGGEPIVFQDVPLRPKRLIGYLSSVIKKPAGEGGTQMIGSMRQTQSGAAAAMH